MNIDYEVINDVFNGHELNKKFTLFSCLYENEIKTPQSICNLFFSLNKKSGCLSINGFEIKYNIVKQSNKNFILTLFNNNRMFMFDVEKGTVEIYEINGKEYVKIIFKKNCCVVKGLKNNNKIDKQFTTLVGVKL